MKPINLRRAIGRGGPTALDKWGANQLKESTMDSKLKQLLNDERQRTLLEVKSICETFASIWSKQGGQDQADGANRIKQWVEVALSVKP